MTDVETAEPVLATRRGKAVLALLLAIGFLDFVDASIVNVALPSIRADLGFSVQHLQWVLSAYLVTYGGFMLLGGRLADLIGRRRLVVSGTLIFFASSISGGAAQNPGTLVGSRLAQGVGAAMMLPAALSILTTTFSHPVDRAKAMGAWGALGGLGSAFGVLLGGVLSEYLNWRWVFLVNPPVCLIVLFAIFKLLPVDAPRHRGRLDVIGAVLLTTAMLLLVYTIVDAPDKGWGAGRTVAGLIGAGALLLAFAVFEASQQHPIFPFSIFKIRGLGEADLTMMVAMAGFYSMFFFLTLYLQNVLGFSQVKAGLVYLPATFGVAITAGIGSKLVLKTGTRPLIVLGAFLGAAGIFWLSFIPPDGTWLGNVFAPLQVMAFGLGFVFFGVTTAAQAGVPEHQAGLAAAMINASMWLGGALGIAIFSAIATSRTNHRLAAGASQGTALTDGFQVALLAAAIFLAVAGVIAFRSRNATAAEVMGTETEDDLAELIPTQS
ncbi:MAG TPA: DHA2 family efflux MFS transporter permease subunit [Jatrophihabitantaceae bacterium]|nr:DHA2 family efflux MFS transporter permease subunit [Jatrophihabitantaceae bacterium]